ncbi:MAG TPA: hypothetical protein VFF67_05075 [Thermoplasmata archaeon]|nr:hypothetical protein [Thermoplasmata archaeon]
MPAPAATVVAGVELLLLAAGTLVVGEAVRHLLLRRVPMLRTSGSIERALVSFFLGSAAIYALAWIPLPIFGLAAFVVLVAVAAVTTLFAVRRRAARRPRLRELRAIVPSPPVAIALAAALTLFVVEWYSLASTSSGNTWDASVLALYSSELTVHGHLVLGLAPAGPGFVTYPQGIVVWQSLFAVGSGVEPSRIAVDVDVLFLALAPLAGYVLARRWLSSERAGAAAAVGLLLLGTWTRVLVSGSYDFVAAFPLGLTLVGLARPAFHDRGASRSDVIFFGALAGYSAALNPVPAEWVFVAVAITAVVMRPQPEGGWGRWLLRWALAIGVATLWVVPNLAGLLLDGGGPITGLGPPMLVIPPPLGLGTLIGAVDPFLFGPGYGLLSPFPVLRFELAALLLGGMLLPFTRWFRGRSSAGFGPFYRWSIAAALAAGLLIGAGQLAAAGVPLVRSIGPLTSTGEASILLFTVYAMVALVPIVLLAGYLSRGRNDPGVDGIRSMRNSRPRPSPSHERAPVLAVLGCALLLAPGVVVLVTDFPVTVHTVSTSFGNLSAADLGLLAWSGRHVPDGARVLVAPGGALQFLPTYQPRAIVVFTMVGGASPNGSYALVSFELEHGILDGPGRLAIGSLGVQYIAVTQQNTVLWSPYEPGPLLGDPGTFPVVYHSGDAYLFAVR